MQYILSYYIYRRLEYHIILNSTVNSNKTSCDIIWYSGFLSQSSFWRIKKKEQKYWEKNGLEKRVRAPPEVLLWPRSGGCLRPQEARGKWFKIQHSRNFLALHHNYKIYFLERWVFKSTIFSLIPKHINNRNFHSIILTIYGHELPIQWECQYPLISQKLMYDNLWTLCL